MKTDMIVKLLDLEKSYSFPELEAKGIKIIRPLSPDKHIVLDFIKTHFAEAWASETDVAFSKAFPTCFIAVHEGKVIGFAAYEATGKAYFGPTGVDEKYRGLGVGKALLLESLVGLRELGYTYAIIGGVGSAKGFYEKVVGAISIPDTYPGIYSRRISNN